MSTPRRTNPPASARLHASSPHARSRLWQACMLAGLASTSLSSFGAPLTLATEPPGVGGREPAPNVIVSVDNSGSMGASGIATLKAALNDTFSAAKVPDGRIRLAWQAMWGCRGIPNASAPCSGQNVMKRLEGTHRTNFFNWVTTLAAGGWTPSHVTFAAAGDYLAVPHSGVNSPWASNPGVTESPVLGCRRSYHVFMTDGEWNSTTGWSNIGDSTARSANADGTAFTFPLPDVALSLPADTPASFASYPVTGDQTRATRDSFGTATVSTLADLAFHYWSRDLQTGIPNLIKPLYKDKNPVTVGGTTLQPFWNLKNNPATWQNMTTFAIGFNAAATLAGSPTWDAAAGTWGGAGYIGLVNGTSNWVDPLNSGTAGKAHELWHAALNSRGRFVPAPTAASLSTAFQDILDNILADTSKSAVSIGANSTTTRTVSDAYVASYDASLGWAGTLNAFPLSATGALGTTPTWMAAGKIGSVGQGLDASGFSEPSRLVLSHNGTNGISFEWANLASGQKSQLKTGSDTDTVGENRLKYVRGDKSKEVAFAGGVFRDRVSRLGDIVNSNVWYAGKPSGDYAGAAYSTFLTANYSRAAMVYVGANDGMLHGFDAATGAERLAYVPKGLLGKFINYSSPSYVHDYFVDMQPASGDADLGGATGWKTVLFGGLGGGGKGYFILDITNPTHATNGFTVANASSIVKYDNTGGSDADIGHIYSPPVVKDGSPEKSSQIVEMNNGKCALVLGNGYNSTNERPVLVVHYLDGTAPLKITPTCASSCPGFIGDGNGLSSPRLLDLNSNGTVDVAYAGDLKGNLWKFDLTSATASSWGVAYSNTPYFVAKSPSNVRQPITTAPYALPHPMGGLMLAFGTGRNITTSDPAATDTDTMWGVWDNMTLTQTAGIVTMTNSTLGTVNLGTDTTRPTTLVQQTPSAPTLDTDPDTHRFYDVSRNAVTYTTTASTKRGWYLDWPNGGQRVVQNPFGYGNDRVFVFSGIPQSGTGASGETCNPTTVPAKAFISVFNLFSGNPSVTPVFSAVDTGMSLADKAIVEVSPGDKTMIYGPDKVKLIGADGKVTSNNLGGNLGVRSNWREYQ